MRIPVGHDNGTSIAVSQEHSRKDEYLGRASRWVEPWWIRRFIHDEGPVGGIISQALALAKAAVQ